MALASYALTDLQSVLDRLQTTTHSNPGLVERMINTASWALIRRAGREFKPLTTATVRVFPISDDGYVSFTPSEARTITQIRANVESTSPTILAASDYQTFLWESGTISGFRVVTGYATPSSGLEGRVEVTGTWGWVEPPPDMVQTCEWQVVQWIRRDLQGRSDLLAAGDESVTSVPPYPVLSRHAEQAADVYRVPVVA